MNFLISLGVSDPEESRSRVLKREEEAVGERIPSPMGEGGVVGAGVKNSNDRDNWGMRRRRKGRKRDIGERRRGGENTKGSNEEGKREGRRG